MEEKVAVIKAFEKEFVRSIIWQTSSIVCGGSDKAECLGDIRKHIRSVCNKMVNLS